MTSTQEFIDVMPVYNAGENDKHLNRQQIEKFNEAVERLPSLRAALAQKHLRVLKIARACGVGLENNVQLFDGLIRMVRLDPFTAILEPTIGHFDDSAVRALDTINRCIGASDEQMRRDKWKLFNPFYWLFACIEFVLVKGVSIL